LFGWFNAGEAAFFTIAKTNQESDAGRKGRAEGAKKSTRQTAPKQEKMVRVIDV